MKFYERFFYILLHRSPFSSCLIMSNFPSTLTVFLQLFTWTALGDLDLCFSLILVMLLKRKLHQPCDYITKVINPHMWLMAWQCHHFLLDSDIRQVWPQIVYAKLNLTKNYCINSKSGVNFKVALKQNHINRNRTKWDLPV